LIIFHPDGTVHEYNVLAVENVKIAGGTVGRIDGIIEGS